MLLLASIAVSPAAAQRNDSVDRRVDRIEQELRAVQRRVFPNGRSQFVEPELRPGVPDEQAGVSGDALSALSSRVDAVEAQLRSLTGQIEEQANRTNQLESEIARLRTQMESASRRQETPARVQPEPSREPEPAPQPAPVEAEPETPASSASDPAEEAYNAGYRLWSAGRFAEAQQALETAATRYPQSRWASWARNLQGRAYLDDNKPATAARILLANYQDNPRGERAADSLYFLGQSLARLDRLTEACRVYAELEQVYPNMRGSLRGGLPRVRADARCAETAASR